MVEAECSEFNSLINLTPSITSTHYSAVATEHDIKSPALVDTWQNEGMTNCMMAWTAHDQAPEQIIPKICCEHLFSIRHNTNNHWQSFELQEYYKEQCYCIASLAAANMASA